MNAFGTVLKDIRAANGMSQADLAGQLGSTQRHISFIETGRSSPSSAFVMRICRELQLSIAQRAHLFEASGLPSPYPRRALSSEEVIETLDMIEKRVLNNWPFPALVMDEDWTILRKNKSFDLLMSPFSDPGNTAPNLIDVFMDDRFRSLITNWEDVAPTLYYRLQTVSANSPLLADKLAQARAAGRFDSLELARPGPVPVYTPVEFTLPNGVSLRFGSLMGRLASVQDALVEGFELELMVPADEASENMLKALAAA